VKDSQTTTADGDPGRWRMLVLLGLAELLGMSLWFAGTAVAPQLQERWSLTGSQVGWLTTAVQLGFVAGTAAIALLNIADILSSRILFALAALSGALFNAALLAAEGFVPAVATRFMCGVCLAGVYPPAMKMISTWFRSQRGFAVGTIVGGVTVGKATPYLVSALPAASLSTIVVAGSLSAVLAGVMVFLGYRDGPYPFVPRPFSWSLAATVVRERRWRLATGGYLGHMFELYSYWTWIPVFLAMSAAVSGSASPDALSLLAFATIAVGGIGCVWGGRVADRIGRERFVILALGISGACSLLIGLTFGRSWWLLAPVALAWGFFVVADSAQFSVLVTESVPSHAVGTALMIQTSLGFLLTTLTIQLVPPVVEKLGWSWAFPLLLTLKARQGPDNIPAGSSAAQLPSIAT
jgi:MFS family permease